MSKRLFLYPFLCLAALLASCSRNAPLPPGAVTAGGYALHCAGLKPGMYRCRIYRATDGKQVKEATYIWPFLHGAPREDALAGRIAGFDGEAIVLKDGKKLVPCEIPADAALVGSVNGGAWVSVRPGDAGSPLYTCTVYSLKDGSVLSSGAYALKRYSFDAAAGRTRYSKVKERPALVEPVYCGGVGITVGNKRVLMPAGWIEYPEGARSGLRVLYDEEGAAVREEAY